MATIPGVDSIDVRSVSVSEFIKQNYQVDDDPDIGQYKSFEIVRGGEHKNRYDNEAEMLQDKLETNNLDQVKVNGLSSSQGTTFPDPLDIGSQFCGSK